MSSLQPSEVHARLVALAPVLDAFAEALVKALAVGLDKRFSDIVGEIVKGSERFARNLNVEPKHCLVEVLQDADDLGATTVRFHYVVRRSAVGSPERSPGLLSGPAVTWR